MSTEQLAAINFQRRRNQLLLVVVLPDGTPGTIAADATDVFGERVGDESALSALSVEGVRKLRRLVDAHHDKLVSRRRPRPWKVVRHKPGIDPFYRAVCVYSAHTTESGARRACDKERAAMVRASGYAAAARWEWSVVRDPAGLLTVVVPADTAPSRKEKER